MQAALLHNVFEPDTRVDESMLQAHSVGEAALAIVRQITLPVDSRPYLDYIRELCASGDTAALQVKLADNLDAIESLSVLRTEEALRTFREQYVAARQMLQQGIQLQTSESLRQRW